MSDAALGKIGYRWIRRELFEDIRAAGMLPRRGPYYRNKQGDALLEIASLPFPPKDPAP